MSTALVSNTLMSSGRLVPRGAWHRREGLSPVRSLARSARHPAGGADGLHPASRARVPRESAVRGSPHMPRHGPRRQLRHRQVDGRARGGAGGRTGELLGPVEICRAALSAPRARQSRRRDPTRGGTREQPDSARAGAKAGAGHPDAEAFMRAKRRTGPNR